MKLIKNAIKNKSNVLMIFHIQQQAKPNNKKHKKKSGKVEAFR